VSHGSARTTFQVRLLIVQRHQAGWPQPHVAVAIGISRTCVKTWIDRCAAEGEAGLRDLSLRPHAIPTRTSAAVEYAIVELRAQERIGRDEFSVRLGVLARTDSRVLARYRIPRLSMLDPITGEVIRTSKTIRAPRGRISRVVGAHGRQEARPHPRWRKLEGPRPWIVGQHPPSCGQVGFHYVHSLVDDHSRLANSEVLPNDESTTCADFLERTCDSFADHGIIRNRR